MHRINKGTTLLELLIAISLMGLIVVGLSSIDLFSRYHLMTSDFRAKVQNEASFVLEHMSKNMISAVGNERIYGANTVVHINDPSTADGEASSIKVYVDADSGIYADGIRQAPKNNPNATDDHWIAYMFYNSGNKRNQILFCGRCRQKSCKLQNANQCAVPMETLGTLIPGPQTRGHITNLNFPAGPGSGVVLTEKAVPVVVSACWDAAQTRYTCGSQENPSAGMITRIKLPQISTN